MSEPIPFSTALRTRAADAHSDSEHAGFMADLLRGQGTRDDYVELVAQHWYIYAALEAAADGIRRDAVVAGFVDDRLTRLPSLEADLAFLIGSDWRDRIRPLRITRRYAERITEVGPVWAGGLVAHHYTRYLGDLSGGQFIGRVMKRRFGFDDDGIRFYRFEDIADPAEYKAQYRDRLDAAPWDEVERERVIDEVLLAYRFNTELFEELARAKDEVIA